MHPSARFDIVFGVYLCLIDPFLCKEYASKMTKAKWAAMVAEHESYLRSHTPRPNWGENNNTAEFHYNPEASSEENAQV
jgi:hypothetical protein